MALIEMCGWLCDESEIIVEEKVMDHFKVRYYSKSPKIWDKCF